MAPSHRAFLSYAHRYQAWVEVLQQNLEACLLHGGAEPHQVFLDTVDLGSGRSWVGQLQAGVSQAEHLILVMTPEALASPRVEDEWNGFMATRKDWARGHLHLVHLVDCPLPSFLAQMQWVDFEEHDESKYRRELQKLVAGLLGHSPRELPELPPQLTTPAPPADVLPPKLRGQLVSWLAPRLRSKRDRPAIGSKFSLKATVLDGQPSPDCAASALLVEVTGDDDRIAAGLRIVNGLIEVFEEDEPTEVEALQRLKAELERLRQQRPRSGPLKSYLAWVRSEPARLAQALEDEGSVELLQRVVVPLSLRASLSGGAPLAVESPAADEEDGSRHRLAQGLTLRELIERSTSTGAAPHYHWVVRGDPGAGKTTLLRELALSVAAEPSARWVPVFASLPRRVEKGGELLAELVTSLRLSGVETGGLLQALEAEAESGRLLLLLDGLDEVRGERMELAERLLSDLAGRFEKTLIVVTSRPIGYRRPTESFREVDLQPFEHAQKREFLARWFGRKDGHFDGDRADRALSVLDTSYSLQELASNPLYLTLMARLLEHGIEPETNRARLHDQIFNFLLDGKHRLKPEPMEAKAAVLAALAYLAYGLTVAGDNGETEDRLELRLLVDEAKAFRQPLETVRAWNGNLRAFLSDVARRSGILAPYDGEDGPWRFRHRTFKEALTAIHLQTLYERRDGAEAILAHAKAIAGDESRWAEPYALLAGRVKEPDKLVRALVKESPALGLRALATAQGLKEETIAEVLELTTDDVDERGKVFLRLPELLGDGERAVLLIDRLRRATTAGNDLFFLDLAAREVVRLYPAHVRTGESLLGRFFDHIPQPPEDLFRWVETPLDGRVELWREIPAGSFWMGSPEGVGYPDERPRHRVTFQRGFQMAAVPVTNAQYALFDPKKEPESWKGVAAEELPNHPRVNVTWYEAVAFCRWLASRFEWARGARLATEEEWEHACRAGTETVYWSGDGAADLARVGWYDKNSGNRTHRVGEKPANPWGLYDVHGNAWEWTASPWTSDYAGREDGNELDSGTAPPPADAETHGEQRVIRGGSAWFGAVRARAAFRFSWDPWYRLRYLGFRVVLPAVPEL